MKFILVFVFAASFAPAASAQQNEPFKLRDVAVTASVGENLPIVIGERGAGDVFVENAKFLTYDRSPEGPAKVGVYGVALAAELVKGLGNYLEAALGAGYQRGAIGTSYTDYVSHDNKEVRQSLLMTNIPVSMTASVFPLGRDKKVQPYVGGGVQANNWRYQESGQFIDFGSSAYPVYKDTYKTSGSVKGPVLVVGVRAPVGRVSIGGEYRKQWASGALPAGSDFAGNRINLGGSSIQAKLTVNVLKRN